MHGQSNKKPSVFTVLRDLHSGKAGVALRILANIVFGLAFLAAALLATWGYAALFGSSTIYGGNVRRFRVREEHLAVGTVVAGLLWLVTFVWVWGGFRRGRFPWFAALGTIVLWLFIIPICFILETAIRHEEEFVITGVCLLAGALTVLMWMLPVHRLGHRTPVVNGDNMVNVHCPQCGYSLIGLRELRCPECGARFTIDELIRRQDYGHTRIPPPFATVVRPLGNSRADPPSVRAASDQS